ncbi:MAG: prolipoprotein diacylglyceryl transferase [Bryobacteraceae bacterium]
MLWHFVFESIAYVVAFRLYLWQRREHGDFLSTQTRWTIIVAAIAGAAVGSKLLYWFEDPVRTLHEWKNFRYLLGGKTIVGALLGGIIAVECAKWHAGITRRTGDLFAVPIALGIAIGRLGCFLAGIKDDTYGLPTTLPWGVDLGDGIHRHPVQLYEIVAMGALIFLLRHIRPPRFEEGDRFRVFVIAYCTWRVFIDFLKPGVFLGGFTILQWACIAALIWYARDLERLLSRTFTQTEALSNG